MAANLCRWHPWPPITQDIHTGKYSTFNVRTQESRCEIGGGCFVKVVVYRIVLDWRVPTGSQSPHSGTFALEEKPTHVSEQGSPLMLHARLKIQWQVKLVRHEHSQIM